jgi:hypothetical protein
MAPASDPEWPRHGKTRHAALEEVKQMDAYLFLKDRRHDVNAADLSFTPDPDDAAISTRSWELSLQGWRSGVTEYAQQASSDLELRRCDLTLRWYLCT